MPSDSQPQPPSSSSQDAPVNDNSAGTRGGTSAGDNLSTSSAQPRQGVTRLDTLGRRGGSSPTPQALKIKPKATASRRSVQEREEAEREEQRRLEARNIAAANASGSSSHIPLSGDGRGGFFRGRGYQRGRGWFGGRGGVRGGYAMPYPERIGEGVASGPFGAGSVLTASARKKLLTGAIRGERTATTSSSRSGQKPKTDKEGDVSMSDRQKLKHENLDEQSGFSSDEDDPEEGPRVSIDLINLVSDDEVEDNDGKMKGKRPNRRPNRGLRPVRLEARERVKRGAVRLGPEMLSISAMAERRQVGSPEGVFVPRDLELEKGRKRMKDKEVEFLGGNKIYKGVYPPDEEEVVQVKSEPVDESEAVHLDDISASENQLDQDVQQGRTFEVAKKGKSKAKEISKSKRKTQVKLEMPVFQTEEDIEEWARNEEDIRMLSQELGLLPLGKGEEDDTKRSTTVDKEGDVEMRSHALDQEPNDKYGRLYLFQFPPILPPLHDATLKSESQPQSQNEDQIATIINLDPNLTSQQPSSSSTSNRPKLNPSEAIIIEDSNKQQTGTQPPSFASRFPSGRVGKLTLRKSGRLTLTWGINEPSESSKPTTNKRRSSSSEKRGLQFQIDRGADANFLQDVVLAENIFIKQEQDQDNDSIMRGLPDNRRPRAIALSHVVGKMVAIPDWESLL